MDYIFIVAWIDHLQFYSSEFLQLPLGQLMVWSADRYKTGFGCKFQNFRHFLEDSIFELVKNSGKIRHFLSFDKKNGKFWKTFWKFLSFSGKLHFWVSKKKRQKMAKFGNIQSFLCMSRYVLSNLNYFSCTGRLTLNLLRFFKKILKNCCVIESFTITHKYSDY